MEDETSDGSSGEVEIERGGVSFNFVEFKFISNIGRGMKYNIELYTKSE